MIDRLNRRRHARVDKGVPQTLCLTRFGAFWYQVECAINSGESGHWLEHKSGRYGIIAPPVSGYWRDVDLDSSRLSIRQQLTRNGTGWGFGLPKSSKSVRFIDVDPETVELLGEQRERQRFERRAWGDAYRSDLDLVFGRPDGSAEDPDVVGRRFGRRVRTLPMLPAIGLHGLRHTHATLLLEEGVDIKTVSERLGHDSVQTTLELYAHVTPRMRGNAAARFESLLKRARLLTVAQAAAGGS
jgi:hypothetical protein